MNEVIAAARARSVVVFAGAGVSMAPPTLLPGWKALNAAVFSALRRRLAAGMGRDDLLSDEEGRLIADRDADRYPPDYQAQVIEEMCGERYFRGLQSLDVDVTNIGHRGIATLAAAGAVRAIVTTNFDCLLERALESSGVAHVAAIDADGYSRLRDRLRAGGAGPLPIIKIHGSVSEHLSMIDTLKQRRRGRSKAIEECLELLFDGYWLYLGFSADDLISNPAYLGLVAGASRSQGATFVAFPGKPDLGGGAQLLMSAYGDRGRTVVADVGAFVADLCTAIGQRAPTSDASDSRTGRDAFHERLETWAASLPVAATGVSLAAVLESAHQSETAARVLDRLVRSEIVEERGTTDFQLLQLQYGRLGAAFGRFINVPDMNGVISNASIEAVQSLLRLQQTSMAGAALGWMPCLLLWLNDGASAMQLAAQIIKGAANGDWGGMAPQSDEQAVDAWLAAAQVCSINGHPVTLSAVAGTFDAILARARRSGDVVRTGRVIAMYALALAATQQDVPAMVGTYTREFNDVRYAGDGVTIAFTALALGWWHVGPGGITLARQLTSQPVAERALQYLNTAIDQFGDQGGDPWVLFARIQAAKALFDSGELDAAGRLLDDSASLLDRFPVFLSYAHEAAGQMQLATHSTDATARLRQAISAAEQSGLMLRRDVLKKNYDG